MSPRQRAQYMARCKTREQVEEVAHESISCLSSCICIVSCSYMGQLRYTTWAERVELRQGKHHLPYTGSTVNTEASLHKHQPRRSRVLSWAGCIN